MIVLDTNVLISALRSRSGASFRLLSLVGAGRFDIALSVPLVLAYEGVADRLSADLAVTAADLSDILDYLCAVAIHRPVFFLWRPTLPDPKDDPQAGPRQACHATGRTRKRPPPHGRPGAAPNAG